MFIFWCMQHYAEWNCTACLWTLGHQKVKMEDLNLKNIFSFCFTLYMVRSQEFCSCPPQGSEARADIALEIFFKVEHEAAGLLLNIWRGFHGSDWCFRFSLQGSPWLGWMGIYRCTGRGVGLNLTTAGGGDLQQPSHRETIYTIQSSRTYSAANCLNGLTVFIEFHMSTLGSPWHHN